MCHAPVVVEDSEWVVSWLGFPSERFPGRADAEKRVPGKPVEFFHAGRRAGFQWNFGAICLIDAPGKR